MEMYVVQKLALIQQKYMITLLQMLWEIGVR